MEEGEVNAASPFSGGVPGERTLRGRDRASGLPFEMARITVMLPEPLKEELDAYAAEHSRLYEPVETAALIPHMLEAFIRSDRAWRSGRKQTGKSKPVNRPLDGPHYRFHIRATL